MIISHKHKYLFVELPRTGSTTIGEELCQLYAGSRVLHRHATYEEFLGSASIEEKKYFVFSGIRNPLDEAVSFYFKCKTDHNGTFSLLKQRPIFTRLAYLDRIRRFDFIRDRNADFPSYFLKFFKTPHDNWSALSHKKFDYVIRFENLEDDFSSVLALIGLEQVRPLPVTHRTREKRSDYLSYYNVEARERAKQVFGPFMEVWNYPFPPEWGDATVSWWIQKRFEILGVFRKFSWKHLRPFAHARVSVRDKVQEKAH